MLLNQTTAVVRVYMPVRKSDYWAGACQTPVRYVVLYPFQLVVTETPPAASAFKKDGVRRDEAASLYISYMVYMINTQTRCTMVLLLAVISEERLRRRPSTSGSRPRGKISRLRYRLRCIHASYRSDHSRTDPVIQFS